ncbi:MAG: hypothetical protein Q9174_001902 [Haloplaca sp. 1 TL-2023]
MQVYNLGNMDCTGVKPNVCTSPDPTRYTPQEWYVLYNIFAINQVFLSLYQAIGNANTLASERVGAIVQLLNPPTTENVLANDLLAALSVGLSLLAGPAGVFAGTLVRAAQQAPNAGRILFPVGTTDTRVAQWANIANELSSVVQNYQTQVSDVIPAINNDLDTFLAFTGNGDFSVNPLPDLSEESDALLQGLTTFIIGKALDANNIHLSRAIDTNVQELQQSAGDELAFDTGCANDYDAKGICGPYWYDGTTRTTYTLNDYNNMAKSYHDQMETMFGNWTTGDLLFAGASRCQASGGLKDGNLANTIINADASNYVTLDCLSSAKVCTFNPDDQDVEREFTDCDSQPDYVSKGCSNECGDSSGSVFQINVPNGYIGAYLTGSSANQCVCHD